MSNEEDRERRERCKPERRGENGSSKDRKGEEGREGGEELSEGESERKAQEELSGTSRSMLAPQSLSRRQDYRTHNAAGPPAACRSPTWELQVGTEELSRKEVR